MVTTFIVRDSVLLQEVGQRKALVPLLHPSQMAVSFSYEQPRKTTSPVRSGCCRFSFSESLSEIIIL